MQTKRYNH